MQLGRLAELVAVRNRIAQRYDELLADAELLELPVALPDRVHPWQSYVLTLDAQVDRGRTAMALRSQGIGCNIGTYASHLQPIYATSDGPPAPCPTSATLFRQHLALPMHAELSDSDVDHVVAVLGDVVDEQLVREA